MILHDGQPENNLTYKVENGYKKNSYQLDQIVLPFPLLLIYGFQHRDGFLLNTLDYPLKGFQHHLYQVNL
jgi:hypothetical protein